MIGLELGGSWGVFSNTTISSFYHVNQLNKNNYLIKGESICIAGKVNAEFIYSISQGFTKLEYWFFDTYHITFVQKIS